MFKKILIILIIPFLSACSTVEPPADNLGVIQKENMLKTNQEKTEETPSPQNFENLAGKTKSAIIKTNFGDIEVEFFSEQSPETVNNFLNLAKIGFYDNTRFHRVMKDFMIQGGDPLSKNDSEKEMWGRGGPGYKFDDEINQEKLVKGSLAMANSGKNTNGSQFFIVTTQSTPWLDGKHTNFGRVISGMDTIEKIENLQTDDFDRPTEDAIIEKIELNFE